ncbi:MAG TPA: hypothetical protein VIT89_01815 [Solirubrobacterales bacterium]
MLAGAIAFVVLILVPVAIGVVIAERRTRQMKGNKLLRDKDERNAMSRLVAGMGRWGSSSGGGGGGG